MNTWMPCGLEDDRIRFEPDVEEDEEIRTPLEISLSWLCDEWKDALADSTYDNWRDIRMMVYGASQALVYAPYSRDVIESQKILTMLAAIALEYSLECLREQKVAA